MKQFDKVLLMTLLMYAFFASFIYASVEEEEITMEVGTTRDYSYFSDNDEFNNSYYWQVIGESVILASEVGIKTNIMAVKPGKCIVIETRKREKGYALAYECYYDYLKLTITVTGTDPTSMVMQHQLHLGIGQTHTLSPRLLPSGSTSTLTWYSSNTSVATVSNGKITAVAVGDATITCITANGLREDCNVTVTPRLVSSISLNQQELRMNVGDRYQFSPVISPTNATYQQVTWQSLKPDVVTVNENGMASCLSNGQAVILATTIDGSNLTAASFVQVGDNCDVNGDGNVSISDVSELISCLLNGGESASNTTTFTVGGVNFTMVNVEGGTFTMGATAEQGNDAYDREKPAHQVTLSSYSIGQTEVTQALWYAVMGSNPSDFTGNQQCPVEMVSWDECQQFITRLNALTGKNFRLPTEAEWEFAARGGNTSQGTKYSGSNDLNEVGWYMDNSNNTTHAVATKSPNELGLYDMSGNVLELCQDWYSDSYSSGAQTNPTGPSSGTQRVIRGGSYKTSPNTCRVSFRYPQTPTQKFSNVGFRLAL